MDETAVRGAMDEDLADCGLLDVSELGLAELLTETDDSALGRALNRILSSPANGACNGFSASI
jgi:FXSXX-COOH protein